MKPTWILMLILTKISLSAANESRKCTQRSFMHGILQSTRSKFQKHYGVCYTTSKMESKAGQPCNSSEKFSGARARPQRPPDLLSTTNVPILYDIARQTPLFLYVNKPKKTSPTSHTMSHSAQFLTSSILLCPKSFWKIKRIVLELGRKAISVLWSLNVQFQKHMIHHFCLAPGTPGAQSSPFLRFYTRFHQTRYARIPSRVESTDLCSSDAKLIYREEQQPFWNVRGVQSRHGTLANYSRSRLSLHSTRTNLINELYAASISTRMVTKHHFVFPLKLSKTT